MTNRGPQRLPQRQEGETAKVYPYQKDITLRERLALFVACSVVRELGWSRTPELEVSEIKLTETCSYFCTTEVGFSSWEEDRLKYRVEVRFDFERCEGSHLAAKDGHDYTDTGAFRAIKANGEVIVEFGI